MKKYLKIILPVAVILSLGLVFWQVKTNGLISNTQGEQSIQKISAVLIIDSANTQTFEISDFVGKTVLEATRSVAKVVTNGTGTYAYVTTINGREADAKKHEFWEFDINGSPAQVGAGSYIIKNNDEIKWKISNY